MGSVLKFPFVVLWFVVKLVLAVLCWSFAILVICVGIVLGLFFDGMNSKPASQSGGRQGRQPQGGFYD